MTEKVKAAEKISKPEPPAVSYMRGRPSAALAGPQSAFAAPSNFQTAGNLATQRLLKTDPVQAKLRDGTRGASAQHETESGVGGATFHRPALTIQRKCS